MNSTVSYEEVDMRLRKLFKDRFEIDIYNTDKETLDRELLGSEFRLAARDLLYLFFDVEKEFGITIPQEDVAEGRFNTFNNVAEIIYKQL